MSSELHMDVITSHNSKVYEMTYKRKWCIPRSRINTVSTTQSWKRCKANHKHGVNKDFKGGGHGNHLEGLIPTRKSLARMACSMVRFQWSAECYCYSILMWATKVEQCVYNWLKLQTI